MHGCEEQSSLEQIRARTKRQPQQAGGGAILQLVLKVHLLSLFPLEVSFSLGGGQLTELDSYLQIALFVGWL